MQEFTGTVVFVSHDRYFIDKLATRIFEVEEGRVHILPRQLRRLSVAEERAARKRWRRPQRIVTVVERRPLRRKRPKNASIR